MKRRLPFLLALSALTLLSGCIAVGGTRSSSAIQPTSGQQLIDLKRALDCGAITPAEYDAKKAQILKGCAN